MDIAGEVVEHGGQVHPAPANDSEVSEVGLRHSVRPCGLGMELIGRFHHDVRRAGDQVVRLEKPVNRSFGHEVALLVSEAHRQFAGQLSSL